MNETSKIRRVLKSEVRERFDRTLERMHSLSLRDFEKTMLNFGVLIRIAKVNGISVPISKDLRENLLFLNVRVTQESCSIESVVPLEDVLFY